MAICRRCHRSYSALRIIIEVPPTARLCLDCYRASANEGVVEGSSSPSETLVVELADSDTPSDMAPSETPPSGLPFSCGAAGVTILWLIFHDRVGLALLLVAVTVLNFFLLMTGPGGTVVAIIVSLAITIAFGLTGSRIAWTTRAYPTIPDLISGERVWTVIGIVGLILQVFTVFRWAAAVIPAE